MLRPAFSVTGIVEPRNSIAALVGKFGGRLNPGGTWHFNIKKRHIRAGFTHGRQHLITAAHLLDHLKINFKIENHGKRFTNHLLIVGKKYSQRHGYPIISSVFSSMLMRMRHPSPTPATGACCSQCSGAFPSVRMPPASSMRVRRPVSPLLHGASPIPMPLSITSNPVGFSRTVA